MTEIRVTNKIDNWENHQSDVLTADNPDEFAAQVSHELRTPLTSIRGALGLLLSGKLGALPPQGKRMLEIAFNNTDRLVRLIEAIENDPEVSVNILTATAMARLRLENDLHLALDRQEFQLHYQPIVLLETHEITGFEALVRWQHPRQGVIFPTEFIPLAEETGLIKRLGTWVLREACRQLHSWQQQSRPFLTMSVNLSSIQLSQPDLVEQVQEILRETGVAYGSLRLEITESAIIENQATAIATLRKLKALGIQLYMDDFGTGYSSLSRLHDLPIDVLKIDRSFVCQQKWDIIQAIMILSASLKLKVIAEGVETPEELENLNRLGCTQAQGYLFSKPLDCQAAWALVK